ncbi:hypothetical protein CVN76_22280 [Bacillus sp. mrc49]|nr:hypothetical protein CVN76_22280 [Bacillus sp. mrc49]
MLQKRHFGTLSMTPKHQILQKNGFNKTVFGVIRSEPSKCRLKGFGMLSFRNLFDLSSGLKRL